MFHQYPVFIPGQDLSPVDQTQHVLSDTVLGSQVQFYLNPLLLQTSPKIFQQGTKIFPPVHQGRETNMRGTRHSPYSKLRQLFQYGYCLPVSPHPIVHPGENMRMNVTRVIKMHLLPFSKPPHDSLYSLCCLL